MGPLLIMISVEDIQPLMLLYICFRGTRLTFRMCYVIGPKLSVIRILIVDAPVATILMSWKILTIPTWGSHHLRAYYIYGYS